MKNQTKEYSFGELISKGAINGCIKFYRLYEYTEFGIKLFAG